MPSIGYKTPHGPNSQGVRSPTRRIPSKPKR